MFTRGRRIHANYRRPASPLAAPSPAAGDSGTTAPDASPLGAVGVDPPEIAADALIAAYRLAAYSEARKREARALAEAAHWREVAGIVVRRGNPSRAGPRVRDAIEVDLTTDPKASPWGRPGPFPEVNPLDELQRILAAKPHRFRLQFFGRADDRGPAVLGETEIEATDASEAIRAAVEAPWPARAIGLRVLDREGVEIFERLKADRR